MGPDEPRYASIARAMAETGDWVTPRLNGAPWFEKPPLYYWSAAIGFRLFSSPEVAARIPSSFFALTAILAVLWIAHRVYGATVAHLAGWMLPTSVGMLGFAHAAATDMPFASCLTLAIVVAAVLMLDESPGHQSLWAAAFGAVLGLAVLAKGPAALVLAGGSTALWAITTANIRRSLRLFHPLAIVAFFLVALPWYVLCAARNPEFLRIFLLEHNVERFLTNRFQHQQPFWFFVPILLLAVFPWTLLLVPALGDAWRAFRNAAWRQSPTTYFAAWVIFPFVFFSASQSKLPGYILPAVPALLLLLARTLAVGEERAVHPTRSRLFLVAATLLMGGIVAMIRAGVEVFGPKGSQPAMLRVALALICGGLLVSAFAAYHRLRMGAATVALSVAVAAMVVSFRLLSAWDPQISARTVAAEAAGALPVCRSYRLPRSWQYGLEFYSHGTVAEWTPGSPVPAWVLTDFAGAARLRDMGWKLQPLGRGSAHAGLFRVSNSPR